MSWMIVAVAANAVIAGANTMAQGRAAEAQYRAQSQADEYNAAVARMNADATRASYGQREEQQRRAARLEAGKRAAAAAQSGLGFEGTNADFERQQSVLAELDALNIRYEGELDAQGLLSRATSYSYSGSVNRSNASSTRALTAIGTAGSLLSGATSGYAAFTRGR